MSAAGRRFTSTLFLVFGPLFVLGGFLFAFSDPGAVLVYFGAAMFVSGVLLRTRLPIVLAVGVGLALFCLLLAWLVVERSG